MAIRVSDLRIDYTAGELLEDSAPQDPFALFGEWWQAAAGTGLKEPNAMALATCTPEGIPSCRMVLLKGFDPRGFVFFTNYESRKGRELESNPHAALTFYWDILERQVRIEGTVERVEPALSDTYFHSRPLKSRLAAVASRQSHRLNSRRELEEEMARLETQYSSGEIQRPPEWGGYRVAPRQIEFWQGRRSRLHDRLLYVRQPDGSWTRERLSP